MNTLMLRSALMIVTLGWASLFAQEQMPALEFQETTHNFGDIPRGVPVTTNFTFTNVSDAPIKLDRVRASCGCTTPSYTQEEIAPGANGEIKVRYNAAAVGNFTKTVTVNYTGGERPMVLYIKGKVLPDESQEDQLYSNRVGMLGFDRLSHNVGVLNSDQQQAVSFKVKNLGQTPITFSEEPSAEMMLSASFSKQTLNPGEKGEIILSVDGEKFISAGPFTKTARIATNDEATGEVSLSLVGNLNKVYSEEELALMPNIEFEKTNYDAGTVIEGEKVEVAFTFTNTGKSDLRIESVKASCGCTASAPRDEVIAPGESSEILATFDSRGRTGVQNKSITVRTNDPDQGTVILRLMVQVERDPFHMGNSSPAAGSR